MTLLEIYSGTTFKLPIELCRHGFDHSCIIHAHLSWFQLMQPQTSQDSLDLISQLFRIPGARPTKAKDVTIQRYRNSHAKIEASKMHIWRCMGLQFFVKFQRCPLKFHTKFEPIHRIICIVRGVKIWWLMLSTRYDILSFSETGTGWSL